MDPVTMYAIGTGVSMLMAEMARRKQKAGQRAGQSLGARENIAAQSQGMGKDFKPSASEFHPIGSGETPKPAGQYGNSEPPPEDLMSVLSGSGLGDAVTGADTSKFQMPEPDLTGVSTRLGDVLPPRQDLSTDQTGQVGNYWEDAPVSPDAGQEVDTSGADLEGIANYAKLGSGFVDMWRQSNRPPPSGGVRSAHMGGPMMRVTGQSSPDTLNALLAEIKKRRGF